MSGESSGRRKAPFQIQRVLLALAAAACLATSAHAVQITDDRGKTFEFKAAPQRIVSLLPSLTESVCALQQCHRLA